MRAQLGAGLRMLLVMTVVLGLGYPVVVTGLAQLAFGHEADGSLLENGGGTVVGSSLVGQGFEGEEYFGPRPSAAGDGYDGAASSASNLGPTNETFLDEVDQRVGAYRQRYGLGSDVEVPVDAVTASGSGLDPHISVANARLQAPRVAAARGVGDDVVAGLVEEHTTGRSLGFLGEEAVNVLELNLALDAEAEADP